MDTFSNKLFSSNIFQNNSLLYIIGTLFISIIFIILIIVLYYTFKEQECSIKQYLDSNGICKPCNSFENIDGIVNDSCNSCTGPLPTDCRYATCEVGYYSVYNEERIECSECRTQVGCNINDTSDCYTINDIDGTYKCNIAGNLDGYYVNAEGIVHPCSKGTFNYSNENSPTGCTQCTSQIGCKNYSDQCLKIEGYENKLYCYIDGNEEGYYINNDNIAVKCDVGTYNMEGQVNQNGCNSCVPQANCTNSDNICSTERDYKDKLICSDTFEELRSTNENLFINDKGIIDVMTCTSPDLTGYNIQESNLKLDNFYVQATCSRGYNNIEDIHILPCTVNNTPYIITGCEKCTEQTGCTIHSTECLNIPNYETKLSCELNAADNGFYVNENNIAVPCENGTYSDQNTNGCSECTSQENCKIDNQYCLDDILYKNKLSCSKSKITHTINNGIITEE